MQSLFRCLWRCFSGFSLVWLVSFLGGCQTVLFPPGNEIPAAICQDWQKKNDRFAITENRSDLMSFVTADMPQPQLLGNLPVGDIPVELEGPHHVAASPDGKYLYYNLSNYVPGTGSGPHGSHGLGLVPGSLVKIDACSGAKVAEVLVDRSPGDVILSADGNYAYVTHYDTVARDTARQNGLPGTDPSALSAVAIVDTRSMQRLSLTPVCVLSHGEGLSPDGKMLYVTCAQLDQVGVLDVSDPAHPVVKGLVAIGPNANTSLGMNGVYFPYALTVLPSDGSVWVSNNSTGDVRVFDPTMMKMDPTRVFPVGGIAMFGDFTPDRKKFLVPHQGDDQLSVIDVQSHMITTLPLPSGSCLNAHMLRVAPGGARAIIICEGDHLVRSGTAVMFDVAAQVVTGFVPLALFPDGAAWLPPAM